MASKAVTAFLTLSAVVSLAHGAIQFTREPSDVGGEVGSTLVFRCGAVGEESLKVEWQVNGVVLPAEPDDEDQSIQSTRTGSGATTAIESALTISNVQISDSATPIMCLASDSSNTVLASRKVALSVFYINSDFRVTPSFDTSSPQLEVGSRVTLQCQPPFAFPKSSVTWYRNGVPVRLDGRVSVTVNAKNEESRLSFQKIVPADDGVYACHASNLVSVMVSRGTLDLRTKVPSGDYSTIVFVTPANTETVIAQEAVKFTCHAFGQPPPETVTWHTRKGALIVQNNKYDPEDRNLTIFANSAGKSRTAVCHANNSVSVTNAEESVTVFSASVADLNTLADQTVDEATRVILNCTAPEKFYPAPTFQWFDPSGAAIVSGVRRTITHGTRYSSLEVNPIYLSDAGVYTCNASNPLLKTSTSVTSTVTVTRSAGIIRRSEATRSVDFKVTARLPCEVRDGGTLLPVTWQHQTTGTNVGRLASVCENCRVYVETDGTLVFSPPQREDSGVWRCIAPSGSEWARTNITVKGKPFFTRKPTEVQEVTLGSLVEIDCAATGIPAPTVQWRSESGKPFSGGKIAEFNSTLIINVTADYHNAVFRCLAGNVNGLNFTDVRFRIVAVNSGGNGDGDSSSTSIIVTIAIVIPCAVLYIAAMVVLVLWCQKRRYRLHRMSKESSEAEGEDGEISGRELDTIKKEGLETVAEVPPPSHGGPGDTPSTNDAPSGPEDVKLAQEVAKEEHHEQLSSKPPQSNLDTASGVETTSAIVERPESPPVTATPILFRAPEPHGIPHSSLNELPRFKREQCKIKKQLGRGYFTTYSDVSNRFMSGFAADTSMMLTTYKASAQDVDGYTRDLLALASLRHKNIASCIAVSAEKHPYCTLSEYYPQGDLKHILRQRDNEADLHLQYHHQLSILLQLCDAMQYLSARRFVHRDVAAHSCIVNSAFQVKLAFFARSKEGYPEDYYSASEEEEPLPVRWMSPESLQSKEFTIQNDIWSFGVLMWEIFSAGEQPYTDVESSAINSHVHEGERLSKPEACPEGAYKTMCLCWELQPKDRLHFSQLTTRLHQLSSTSDL